MFIGISCGRSESVPTLQLIVMMLRVLAQLFAFTRFPFMSGKVEKRAFRLRHPHKMRSIEIAFHSIGIALQRGSWGSSFKTSYAKNERFA